MSTKIDINKQKFDNIVIKPANLGEYSMRTPFPDKLISNIRHIYNSIPKDKKLPAFAFRNIDYFYYYAVFLNLGDIPHFYKNPDSRFILNYYQYSLASEKINDEMLTAKNFNKIYNKNPYKSQVGKCQYRLKNVIPLYNESVKKYSKLNGYVINTDKVYKEILIVMLTFIKNFINNEDISNDNIEKYQNDFRLNKTKIFNKIKEKIKTPGNTLGLICASDDITLAELRIVATVNNIKNSSIMTKEQLCGQFKKIIESNNNKMNTAICNNDTNMLGDDIKSIPPSNFIDYEENGVTYCFDIVEIIENKVLKNPYTRSNFSDIFLKQVSDKYNNLILSKQDVEENITDLMNKVFHLSAYLNYELYLNASDEQLHLFIKLLNIQYNVDIPTINDKKEILKQILDTLPRQVERDFTIIELYKSVFMYWDIGEKLETLRPGFIYPEYLKLLFSNSVERGSIYDIGIDSIFYFPEYVENYVV